MRSVLIPYRLQTGTSFEESLPALNEDFLTLGTSFNGFAVENQLSWPDNVGTITLLAGQLGGGIVPSVSSSNSDPVTISYPRLSVFIDAPAPGPNDTTFDANYLFPNGSALTAGQKAFLVTGYCSLSPTSSDIVTATSFVSNTDGKTYYYTAPTVYVFRNADSAPHTYSILFDSSVYSSSASFYS